MRRLLCSIAAFFVLTTLGAAQDRKRVAVLDFDRVISGAPEHKRVSAHFPYVDAVVAIAGHHDCLDRLQRFANI